MHRFRAWFFYLGRGGKNRDDAGGDGVSLKDLIADVNVNEICEHIETETLSEWVNAWQEAAISALRPISRECGNKAAKKIVQEVLKND